MPMHLEVLSPIQPSEEDTPKIFTDIVEAADDYYQPAEGFVHFRTKLFDRFSGELIGHFSSTMVHDEKAHMNRLLDVDTSFVNDNPVILQLGSKIGQNSFACQYFNATYGTDAEQQLWIETVNRFTQKPKLEGKEVEARISVFPTNLTLYDDMEALNEAYGMNKPIENPKLREIGITNIRYSDNFLAVTEGKNMLFGTVLSFRNVMVYISELTLDFVLATVRTTFGPVPVALSKDYFDIDGIHPGSAVAMYAYLSADLASPRDFRPFPKE